MAKDDVVKSAQGSIDNSLTSALGSLYDSAYAQGQEDQKASGNMSQSDVDAAVAAQKSSDIQALNDANLKSSSDLAALKAEFEQLQTKENLEESTISGLSQALGQAKASIDAVADMISSQQAAISQPAPVVSDSADDTSASASGGDKNAEASAKDSSLPSGTAPVAPIDPASKDAPVEDSPSNPAGQVAGNASNAVIGNNPVDMGTPAATDPTKVVPDSAMPGMPDLPPLPQSPVSPVVGDAAVVSNGTGESKPVMSASASVTPNK